MPNIPLVADDIETFFELGELSINAVFGTDEILVIFRENYFDSDSGVWGIDNASPMLIAKLEDVEDASKGDLIEVEGESFIITSVRPASSELYSKLFLERT